MVNNMGQIVKKEVIRLIKLMEIKPKVMVLLMGRQDDAPTTQPEVLRVDKVEMGEMEMKMIRKGIEIQKLVRKTTVVRRSLTQKTLMNLRLLLNN